MAATTSAAAAPLASPLATSPAANGASPSSGSGSEAKIPRPVDSTAVDSTKPKLPHDTDFQQQRLQAWSPILTARNMVLIFACMFVISAILGGVILGSAYSVVETDMQKYSCPNNALPCYVNVTLNIDDDITSTPFFYYQMYNVYQNHRRYVKSKADDQLKHDYGQDTSQCDPLENDPLTGKVLFPCGLIAQSKFNDEFVSVTQCRNGNCVSEDVSNADGTFWTRSGIATKQDRNTRFTRRVMDPREIGYASLSATQLFRSPNFPETPENVTVDEELMVWMRASALSQFRKLHRIFTTTSGEYGVNGMGLKSGDTLTFTIHNKWDVESFGGSKYILLSTTTWLGGRNVFLGWAYITVAACSLVLAIGIAIFAKLHPRPPGDLRYWKVGRPADPMTTKKKDSLPPPTFIPPGPSIALHGTGGTTIELAQPPTVAQ